MTNAEFLMGVVLIAMVGLALHEIILNAFLPKRKQRPLSHFSQADLAKAFRYCPELKAKYEKRGTLSQHEFRQALNLSLSRIRAEQARRAEAKVNVED